ncbi:MAG: hypothetical protein ACT4N8_09360 [Sphingosinicella sp.]|uniref:hypothetical protein n=1 Tax=Sphingosinicella sp. TaxID=1917971 RepID=UPI00403775D5
MATLPSRLIGAVHQIARAESRRPALWTTRVERDGVPHVGLTLRNVSPSGFMGMASAQIPAGSRITLRLPFGGSVQANVRWSFNGRIGCRLCGRFSRGQLAFLMLCGGLNSLLSAAALRIAFLLGCLSLIILA